MKLLRIHALAVALLPLLVTAQPEWLNNGLVAYYPFDGDARDYSGNGNHGTLRGIVASTSNRFMESGKAYELFGGNDGVVISSSEVFNFQAKPFTVHLWVNDKGSRNAYFVSKYKNPDFYSFGLGTGQPGKLYGFVLGGEHPAADMRPTSPLNDGWQSLAMVVSKNTAQLYINGQEVYSQDISSERHSVDNLAALVIGGLATGSAHGTQSMTGSVDDVRIYNRALSSTEVAELYGYESTPPAKPIEEWINDGLVAYYPFDGDGFDYSLSRSDVLNPNALSFGANRYGVLNGALLTEKGNPAYIPFDTLPAGQNPRSLSMWVQFPTPTGSGLSSVFWGGSEIYNGSWLLHVTGEGVTDQGGGGRVRTDWYGKSVDVNDDYVFDQNWRHLLWVIFEGESIFYVDGIMVQRRPFQTNTVYDRAYLGDVNGTLDDVRIYNRALSSTEVAELYIYESGGKVPARANASVVAGFVVGANILSSGAGYDKQPEIKFIGGNPAELGQAEAVIENGRLIGVNITNAGSGYQSEPTIRIESPPSKAQLGIGISKIETIVPESERPRRAIATANVINGFLVSADLVDGGLGYVQSPIVTVVDATGTGALAATTIENGVVTSVQFVKAGIGYSDKALIQFQSPPPNPDATPRVTEVELSMQLRFPNNYYVIEASSDLVNWEQIVEPFFAEETTHTVKVAVGDDGMRYFRAIQLP